MPARSAAPAGAEGEPAPPDEWAAKACSAAPDALHDAFDLLPAAGQLLSQVLDAAVHVGHRRVREGARLPVGEVLAQLLELRYQVFFEEGDVLLEPAQRIDVDPDVVDDPVDARAEVDAPEGALDEVAGGPDFEFSSGD